MENVARKGGHQHRVGPAKNSDDREQGEDGPDPDMIPNVAKTFERLRERPAPNWAGHMRRQTHHEETGEDSEEARSINEEAERDSNLRHQETGNRWANDARPVEHRG